MGAGCGFGVGSVRGGEVGCGDGLLSGVCGFEPPNNVFQMLIVLVLSMFVVVAMYVKWPNEKS